MFNVNWSTNAIKGNKFHRNFVVRLRAHPLLYREVNLGYGIETQREAKARAIIRMKVKGHVVARVQQPLS
jgi:hypothetical protein